MDLQCWSFHGTYKVNGTVSDEKEISSWCWEESSLRQSSVGPGLGKIECTVSYRAYFKVSHKHEAVMTNWI